jgi:hypothetical protein
VKGGTFNYLQSYLEDANNKLWKEISDIHKKPWDEAKHGPKKEVVTKLSFISEVISLARLVIEEADRFSSDEISGKAFLQNLQSKQIRALVGEIASTQTSLDILHDLDIDI